MTNKQRWLLLAAHFLLALIAIYFSRLLTVYSLALLGWGVMRVVQTKNRNGDAHLIAAYLVGLEILLRMANANVIWEFGKYSVLAILLPACLFKQEKGGRQFWWFFVFLLPSIIVVNFPDFNELRTGLSFNLSGPLLLATSAYYFYDKPFNWEQVGRLLFYLGLPVISLVIYLTLITPDLSQIQFALSSAGGVAGGFGANQVSTILGAGIVVFGTAYLANFSLTPYRWLDYALLFMLAFRGLMTFSRGGMIGAAGALLVGWITLGITRTEVKGRQNLLLSLLAIVAAGGIAWNILNEASEGKLALRYQGETIASHKYGQEANITTGRLQIFKRQLTAFAQSPMLGIGPGMGEYYRLNDGSTIGIPHAEYTRLIGQHGILGVIALMIIVIVPLNRYRRTGGFTKVWLAIFVGLAALTMAHSAMRLAMTGFFYGMGMLVIIENNSNSQLKKSNTAEA